MQFYAVMPDGSRFGPASIDVLNDWIQEGRIVPGTTLQNAMTTELLLAQDLPGLMWAPRPVQSPYSAPPTPNFGATPGVYHTPYGQNPAPMSHGYGSFPDSGDRQATTSMALSGLSLFLCACPGLNLVISGIAVALGYSARRQGSLQASSAIAFAYLALILALTISLLSTGALSLFR